MNKLLEVLDFEFADFEIGYYGADTIIPEFEETYMTNFIKLNNLVNDYCEE